MKRDYSIFYSQGNDCDICENQYMTGIDGDCIGCKRLDQNLECEFVDIEIVPN